MKHSEVAAKLAIEGAVSAIAGTVKGELGLRPRALGPQEKADLGMALVGETLFYEVGESGVFFHTDGAFTTIWFAGGDYAKGIDALDAAVKRKFPEAKRAKDEPHETEPGLRLRTYDIRLPNNQLAIVDAIYPSGRTDKRNFMIRITAMARQN
ncbi:MAG: hypothetical protein NT015_13090 [Alphaproteobacteria bacterium]|nr:hypothetical protein [Alphaproteobacteria bacterium]